MMSKAMWDALKALKAESPRAAYPGLRLSTLDALVARGVAAPAKRGVGAFFTPRTSIEYKITPNGMKALTAHFGPGNF
jgi:hypothetical protein